MIETIHWLGHASFRVDGAQTVYVDPWKLREDSSPADLILITHEHHDHFSPNDVKQIRRSTTDIVTIAMVAKALEGQVHVVKAGDQLTVAGIEIRVLPAYNLHKQFHPRSKGHVGFLVTLDGQKIYFSGDTDAIDEMEGLQPDIAVIPVSGTYVMDAEEAAEAVQRLQPGRVIPMHYGDLVGSVADAQRLQNLVDVPVHILEAER